jgi:hypothetical protein
MAAFPDPAQRVEHNDNFLEFNLHMVDAPLSAVVLVQIRPNGVVADHSRIHLFGNVTLDCYFPATELFSIPEAVGLYFHTSTRPDGIQILMDRTSTAFTDIQAALQDRSMEIVNSDGVPIAAEHFRKKLCSEGHERNAVGACIRWAVAVVDGATVLELQGLPSPVKFLKPHNHSDNIPTIRLSHVPLAMDMGDGHPYQGPLPILFSSDPDAAAAAIQVDHNATRAEIHKVIGRLLYMEHVNLTQAREYLKKFRQATGRMAFDNRGSGPSRNKRVKLTLTPSSSTSDSGTILTSIRHDLVRTIEISNIGHKYRF